MAKQDVTFTRKELSTFCHLSDSRIRTIIDELSEARHIELVAGSNGKTMQYRLTEDVDLVKPCETTSARSKVRN